MILYNNCDSDNLFTDNFWVPTVHVDFTEGSAVKAYIAAHADPQASIHQHRQADRDRLRPVDHDLLVARPEPVERGHHQARHHGPGSADPGRQLAVPGRRPGAG